MILKKIFEELAKFSIENNKTEIFSKDSINFVMNLSFASHEIREKVTCSIAHLKHIDTKNGVDAIDKMGRLIEIKTAYSNEKTYKKLRGSGSFSDFTHKRHQNLIENNYSIITSGFFESKILYIVRFDYNDVLFSFIKKNLDRRLPYGDIKNNYCRSIRFSYTHYKNSPSIEKIFVHSDIHQYEKYFIKSFFSFLVFDNC